MKTVLALIALAIFAVSFDFDSSLEKCMKNNSHDSCYYALNR